MGGSMKTLRIVLIGPIASGKGTISGHILKEFPNFVQISPGDIMRREIKNKTPLGQKVKEYVTKGKLVPDQYIVDSIFKELEQAAAKNWILDGFPRTQIQATLLHETKDKGGAKGLNKNPITGVINLVIPDEIVVERTSNRYVHLPSGRVYSRGFREPKIKWKDDVTGEDLVQRADDRPEIVKDRLKIFRKMTAPVINFYKDHGVNVLTVDSTNTDEAWITIQEFLKKHSK